MTEKKKKFFYKDLADQIQRQVKNGGYRISEKLPSLRSLCRTTGYSMTTVIQAYVELEKRGIVESRDRTGYFIKPSPDRLRPGPKIIHHEMEPGKINLDNLVYLLARDMGDPDILKLGSVAVAPEHLPVKRLHAHLKSFSKTQIPKVIGGYAHPQGDEQLRHQISNLLFPVIPDLFIDDIIITNGCTEALSLSLKAVANPGDTIALESPSDPFIRRMLSDNGLYALEVPADPKLGINPDRLETLLKKQKIAACLLNANCQNPLGFIMPDERKAKIAALLGERQIPIIDNDVSGELYFGAFRPNPVKKWDNHDNILYCASFSKVLAPGLMVGWVIPGRYKNRINRMKLNRSLLSPTLNQALVGSYLKEGTFQRHLRRLRRTLREQSQYCRTAVDKYFPPSVKMTSPSGGLSLWIELPKGCHGRTLFFEARKLGISVLPGFLCSSIDVFHRYIRIGYGGVWDEAADDAVRQIGELVYQMASNPGKTTPQKPSPDHS